MQHRIIRPSRLLDKHGKLIQKGYATCPLLRYRRKDVACKLRLKEWDYYLIYNEKYAVALTVGKSTPILLISASVIDLDKKEEYTKTLVRVVSDKRLSMPESSEFGDIFFQDSDVSLSFKHHYGKRKLSLWMKQFLNNPIKKLNLPLTSAADQEEERPLNDGDLEVSITLTSEPKDSMVIATPFKQSEKEFYYNQKIIGMNAIGKLRIGKLGCKFAPSNSFGLLDWGRGVWPYHTTWYWSACQGMLYGNVFGFNLGYGFGDTSAATENMLFFNGTASKLESVTFHIPKNAKNEYEYMKPWRITSSDHRLQMIFTPILDRNAKLSAVVLSTDQHQVFGRFSGKAILDDGTIIWLKDFLGFAERVENRW